MRFAFNQHYMKASRMIPLLLAVISLGGCNQSSEVSSSVPETIDRDPSLREGAVERYVNSDYGFSFEYPAGWWVMEEKLGDDLYQVLLRNFAEGSEPYPCADNGNMALVLQVHRDGTLASYESFSEYVVDKLYTDEPTLGSVSGDFSITQIFTRPVIKVEWSGFSGACPKEGYLMERSDGYYHMATDYNANNEEYASQVINHLIDSIKEL